VSEDEQNNHVSDLKKKFWKKKEEKFEPVGSIFASSRLAPCIAGQRTGHPTSTAHHQLG
jgi:hypothetical protein